MVEVRWTVVQHSAFGYKGDATFARGLETRGVRTKFDKDAVVLAGGILFDSPSEAEAFAEKAQYPPGVQGLVPQARGTFAPTRIDGLAVYIPVREVIG